MLLRRKVVFWSLCVPGMIFAVAMLSTMFTVFSRGTSHIVFAIGLAVGAYWLSEFYTNWITLPRQRAWKEGHGKD